MTSCPYCGHEPPAGRRLWLKGRNRSTGKAVRICKSCSGPLS